LAAQAIEELGMQVIEEHNPSGQLREVGEDWLGVGGGRPTQRRRRCGGANDAGFSLGIPHGGQLGL
jgi:hypothetical protein